MGRSICQILLLGRSSPKEYLAVPTHFSFFGKVTWNSFTRKRRGIWNGPGQGRNEQKPPRAQATGIQQEQNTNGSQSTCLGLVVRTGISIKHTGRILSKQKGVSHGMRHSWGITLGVRISRLWWEYRRKETSPGLHKKSPQLNPS